jgi:phosphoenolpyruvate synthase/pyruvate phosphate dikinase
MVRESVLVIVDLAEIDPATAGGKATGLARLVTLGLPVPPAVVVPVGSELGDVDDVVARLGEPLAVRSSALGEDDSDRSFAGQYETLLGVERSSLAAAVEQVRRGTARATAYGDGGGIAVVIQREVAATRAGIAFSRDPVTGRDEIVVECAFGGGEAVVSGSVTPDRYRVEADRVDARVAGALRALRDDEVRRIADLVRTAERGFGVPVDVEFCWEGRTVWLVQCRPITTL